MNKTINIKNIFLSLSIVLLVVAAIFKEYSLFLRYIDEILCLIFSFFVLFAFLRNKVETIEKREISILIVIVIMACLSTIISPISRSLIGRIVDLVGILKFFSTYLFIRIYYKKKNVISIKKTLLLLSKAIIKAVFPCTPFSSISEP